MTEDTQKPKISRYILIPSLLWGGIGLLSGVYVLLNKTDFDINHLGDYFAGWFSPLAFGWFIYAVFVQKDELVETRKVSMMQYEELVETRKVTEMQAKQLELQKAELEGSKDALKEQSKALKLQNFENSFFSLVASLMGVVEGMQIAEYKGRAVFVHLRKFLEGKIKRSSGRFDHVYEEYWERASGNLGIYFRLLFRIIKFVDEHNFHNILGKRRYVKFLRSHLSDAELELLFINSLVSHGSKFTRYIIKYDLLDNLTLKELRPGSDHIRGHLEICKKASDIVNELVYQQPYEDIDDLTFLIKIDGLCEVNSH